MQRKGVLILALALILALSFSTAAMAATGLSKIETKWLDMQKLVLKEMVAEGRITQTQADEQLAHMKERMTASQDDEVYKRLSHKMEMRIGFMDIMMDAWARITGQDPQEVRKICREGNTTVWELAEKAGRQDELKQTIIELSTQKLDTLIAEGRITKEQKSKVLDMLTKQLEEGRFGGKGCPKQEQ